MDKFLDFMGKTYWHIGSKGVNGWATVAMLIFVYMGFKAWPYFAAAYLQ